MELDKRIRKLYKDYKIWTKSKDIDWSKEKDFQKELKSIYIESKGYKHMNKNSILIFLVLNQSLRAVTLHHLASYINLEKK